MERHKLVSGLLLAIKLQNLKIEAILITLKGTSKQHIGELKLQMLFLKIVVFQKCPELRI